MIHAPDSRDAHPLVIFALSLCCSFVALGSAVAMFALQTPPA